ncbi:TetR/AcrR family transcriptional regulator C-terminal ligand-binding domain-containing protein [Streptomyces sp. NPDC006477]|uniref:TetR/AcrR family transcriptional regulator C-terminal ligand-binding domain-containing protein n=1 Tax=Streptomyces sp. NPDC006477 TaxID=3364747 RepID=UPI00369FA37C
MEAFGDHAEAAAPTAFVGAAFQSPRAAEALHGFYADRFRRCEVVVARAVARGEAPGGAPTRGRSSARSRRLCSSGSSSPGSRSTAKSPTRRRAVLAAVDAGAYVAE